MSKERARRREQRQREAAARAQAAERDRERTARRQARVAPVLTPLRRLKLALTTGKQTGSLAERKRTRMRMILAALILVQVIVWVVRPDWEARMGALVMALIAFPVIAAFTL